MNEIKEWDDAVALHDKTRSDMIAKRNKLLQKFAFTVRTVYPHKDVKFTFHGVKKLYWSEHYLSRPDSYYDSYCDSIWVSDNFMFFQHYESEYDHDSSGLSPYPITIRIPVNLFDLSDEQLAEKGKEQAERKEKIKAIIAERAKQRERHCHLCGYYEAVLDSQGTCWAEKCNKFIKLIAEAKFECEKDNQFVYKKSEDNTVGGQE